MRIDGENTLVTIAVSVWDDGLDRIGFVSVPVFSTSAPNILW